MLFFSLLACNGDKDSDIPAIVDDTGSTNQTDDTGSTTDDSGKKDDTGTTDDSGTTDDTGNPPPPDLALIGRWVDDYGSLHDISNADWISGTYRWHILSFSNENSYLIAENAPENTYFPNLFSRFDWYSDGADIYYCQTAYNAASQADAEATPAANASDLSSGCGGFPWTHMIPALDIRGNWLDNYGGTHEISEKAWFSGDSIWNISQYSNFDRYIIAQNAATNTYYPNLWSRFDWAWDGQSYYYCQTGYDKASEADALALTAPNGGDLVAGCNGFAWTQLQAPLAISGNYTDSYGGSHSISEAAWDMGPNALFNITFFDNRGQFIVAQNDSNNTYFPDLWSRFDWLYDNNQNLYYCQSAYDAASEDDARTNVTANRGDLATGCGGFSWTQLLP